MVDLVEARLDVGVEHPPSAPVDAMAYRFQGSESRASGSEPVARLQEISLEHRFEDDLGGSHDHPVTDAGNTKWPGGARFPRFGNVDPP